MQVNPFSKAYLTDDERRLPFWHRGEKYEFFTSYDPNHLGVHIVPSYCNPVEAACPGRGFDLAPLMHDIMLFTMYWWGQMNGRLNGFTAYHIKMVLHEYGWQPKDGYDAAVIDTGNALNFEQGEGME